MADIVNSLFGLPSEDVRQQLYKNQLDFSTQYANTYGNEYDKRNALLGGMVGNALANVGAGVFGLQDPQLKRATELERILGETQQEVGADPTALYPALQQKLSKAGYTREAFQVGQVAQKAIQEFGLNQAKMGTEQAQQRKLGVEAATKQQEALLEQQLREELANLPPTATEEDYLAIVRKYAPAKDVMSAIERGQVAKENRLQRSEDLQYRVEADLQRARERNETLIEQARMQGATSRELAAMRIQSAEQIAQLRSDTQRQIAEAKAADKALSQNRPKDVAEAESVLAGVDYTLEDIKKAKDLLDKGQAVFNVKENTIAFATKKAGKPTQNALNQDEVKRQIRNGVNQLLVAAKGTQTEGDAKRAQDLFLAAENTNSNESWKAAMDALIRGQEKVKAEKQRYIQSRGFGATISGKDKEALDWANKNPNDPRAAKIKQRLGQ